MQKYTPIVGLEIHIQAKTKSKMFSSVSADYFGKAPNTCVDPVTLGLPGALPVPNKKAIEHCLRLSLALNCEINKETKFDRKNYFYPDLPKGYQISQYDQPIGFDGYLEVESKEHGRRQIRIRRVHMEEDTGKSIHEGDKTLLDFNKAGVPLIEVVTEPDFKNKDEIDYFAKRLRQIVRLLGVSDADMEKGQMRYELNISLQRKSETELPDYKVEVKNIGSISLLQKVIDFEVERQTELLDKAETPIQETRGTRDMSGKTYSQRVKEEADDYRYFPEPDIPPLHFTAEYIEELRASLPMLPEQLKQKYMEHGIAANIAEDIVSSSFRRDYLAEFEHKNVDSKTLVEVAKLLVGELSGAKNGDPESEGEIRKPAVEAVLKVIELKAANKINSNTQTALIQLLNTGELTVPTDVEAYVTDNNLTLESDSGALEQIAKDIIAKDPEAKAKYAKNPNIVMFYVGQIMRETKGSADPQVVKQVVETILK